MPDAQTRIIDAAVNPSASPTQRRYDLDWIRVGAFGLLILYHVGLVYGVYDWHIHSAHTFAWMREAVLITNPWRLTLLFLVSAVVNLGLCYVLIPLWGGTGAAVAAAAAAVISLVLRTVIGERYYRAIASFRYVGYTVGLMLAASVGNALLNSLPGWKYVFLSALYALALWLFRAELRTLLRTAGQLLRAAKDTLRRRRSTTHEGERT